MSPVFDHWAHCDHTTQSQSKCPQFVISGHIVITKLITIKMGSNCDQWAHCGHIIQQHLKCAQFLIAGYIGVTWCLGPACLHNVPTGYLTPCPQCDEKEVVLNGLLFCNRQDL